MELVSEIKDKQLTEIIRRLMEEKYALGRLTRVREVLGGYCNKSYAVWMSSLENSRRYFLRLYNAKAVEKEIRFEHALVSHLRSNGFTLAAPVIAASDGSTLVRTPAPQHHGAPEALWALFEFLEGEDPYSWIKTDLTDTAFASGAEILARLHQCGRDFRKPAGTDRVQPRIMDFLATFQETFGNYLKQAGERRCDRYFKEHFQTITNAIEEGLAFTDRFRGMPELPIHCDYHPGNLKYRDEQGVGIFDFDWSKIDYRLFDLALALVYFVSVWDDQKTGLRQDKFILFLQTYHTTCGQLDQIEPLTDQERQYLLPMLAIANLYLVNWDLTDFYVVVDQPEDDEYFYYIHHNIAMIDWINAHKAHLARWIDSALAMCSSHAGVDFHDTRSESA